MEKKIFIDIKCVDCMSPQSGLFQFVNGYKSINQFHLSVDALVHFKCYLIPSLYTV